MYKLIREDLRTHREGLFSQGFWALFVYRLSHPRTKVRTPFIRVPYYIINRLMQKFIEISCGICLPETSVVGRRLNIEHFGSIIVHGRAVIGDDVILRQGVTIGNRSQGYPEEAPVIGNRVVIGAGAKVLGNVCVGDGAVIGANAVVVKDVPPGALAVGVPARIIERGVS
ncbi:serine O-acetyltransferase [Devosia sp. BK]|nr:serine O-acetyltransferase [Devosia sp. BK]